MTPQTLPAYLLGSRSAILAIAANRQAVWLGLLLVLSAALAREYDGEDLLHEPWHLLLPLGASLATSALLYGLLRGVAKLRGVTGAGFPSYRSFLGLYWLTAPLAWLYAIPVEQFLTPGEATEANLWLLAIVSLWRVALMTRVASVLWGAPLLVVFPVVMLFADSVMLLLVRMTPLPVFALMGGVRLSESEQVLQMTAFLLGGLGIVTWPIWLVGTLFAAFSGNRRWEPPATEIDGQGRVPRALWALGFCSLAVWLPVLPFTQPQQQVRWQVEAAFRRGEIRQALVLMSAHPRSHFPPHWDPPPRIAYDEASPPLLDVVDEVSRGEVAPWVRSVYLEKLGHQMNSGFGDWYFWEQLSSSEIDRFLELLERLPEGPAIIAEHRQELEDQAGDQSDCSEAQKARIRALLAPSELGSPGAFLGGGAAETFSETEPGTRLAPDRRQRSR